jgi:hypothetical protein
VLRVGQDDVARPPGGEVAEVVECASEDAVAVGAVAAARAGPPAVIAAAPAGLGLGQILDAGDPFGGVGQVFSGSWQGGAPVRWFLQENTQKDPDRFASRPGSDARDSQNKGYSHGVEERVQLDGTLAATESRPREERQAEVDGGGIERVGGLLELSTEAIGVVQPRARAIKTWAKSA